MTIQTLTAVKALAHDRAEAIATRVNFMMLAGGAIAARNVVKFVRGCARCVFPIDSSTTAVASSSSLLVSKVVLVKADVFRGGGVRGVSMTYVN